MADDSLTAMLDNLEKVQTEFENLSVGPMSGNISKLQVGVDKMEANLGDLVEEISAMKKAAKIFGKLKSDLVHVLGNDQKKKFGEDLKLLGDLTEEIPAGKNADSKTNLF
ncbi:hypothetical protein CBER1_11927 [Cercospora berteroae]|uniref:Uncharacterized protein n=1 Tax=Cercospora berteroae TaxID=357750 RepID=A0A2S6C0L8_9PEZI|nr:hypothetical protein CBER1_11927 [Cercospora berteroae]